MDNQINDKLTVQPNAIFETIVRHDTHRGFQAAHDPHTNLQNQPWEAVHKAKEIRQVCCTTQRITTSQEDNHQNLSKNYETVSNNHNIHNQNRQHMHTNNNITPSLFLTDRIKDHHSRNIRETKIAQLLYKTTHHQRQSHTTQPRAAQNNKKIRPQ